MWSIGMTESVFTHTCTLYIYADMHDWIKRLNNNKKILRVFTPEILHLWPANEGKLRENGISGYQSYCQSTHWSVPAVDRVLGSRGSLPLHLVRCFKRVASLILAEPSCTENDLIRELVQTDTTQWLKGFISAMRWVNVYDNGIATSLGVPVVSKRFLATRTRRQGGNCIANHIHLPPLVRVFRCSTLWMSSKLITSYFILYIYKFECDWKRELTFTWDK